MRALINSRFGGVMGKKLVFAVGDAVDPTAAASEATRLASREGVKIITGTFSSTLCGAASEAAARQNVIYWETSCVDPRLTRRNLKNVFRTEIDGTGFGWYNIEFIAKHLAHRFGKAFGNDANGPFALLEPGPGLVIEKFRPEGQLVERAFREAVKTKTGSDVLAGGHQLAGGGLWVLKLALDAAKTDDLDRFRAAVLSLDVPVGSAVNGWGVKFDETGQNSNARVQHYMLQWQNGSLVTAWPEGFTTARAKGIPLGPWDQRK